MIEAYEIGITLALDNGVASGVAAIRQDLDALDRAVARSSVGLSALRSLSASLPSTGLIPTGISSATRAYPAQQPPSRPPALASSDTSAATDVRTAPPAAIAPPLQLAPAQPAPSHVASIETAQSVATAAPGMTASPGQRRPSQIAHADTKPFSPPSIPPITVSSPVTSPVQTKAHPSTSITSDTPPLPGLPQPPAISPKPSPFPAFEPDAPADPISRQPAPLRTSPAQPPIPTAALLPASAPVRPMVPPQPPVAAPDIQFPPLPNRPAAPPAPAHHPAWPLRPETSLPSSVAPVTPASTPSHIGSPVHGELILDGARLGRWMSDRLARAVDRPTSGVTGFDPRISHSHAGAPNGS